MYGIQSVYGQNTKNENEIRDGMKWEKYAVGGIEESKCIVFT